jgi:hypothetical protein
MSRTPPRSIAHSLRTSPASPNFLPDPAAAPVLAFIPRCLPLRSFMRDAQPGLPLNFRRTESGGRGHAAILRLTSGSLPRVRLRPSQRLVAVVGDLSTVVMAGFQTTAFPAFGAGRCARAASTCWFGRVTPKGRIASSQKSSGILAAARVVARVWAMPIKRIFRGIVCFELAGSAGRPDALRSAGSVRASSQFSCKSRAERPSDRGGEHRWHGRVSGARRFRNPYARRY